MDKQPHILLEAPVKMEGDFGMYKPAELEKGAKLHVESLTPEEFVEAKQQPELIGAPGMRVRLIEPIHASVEQAAEVGDVPLDWGIEAIGGLGTPYTGAGIKVAVLDTGIDKEHSAFDGLSIKEEDFTGDGNGDQNGHGTHCAGTIVGRDTDGHRIGVARGVTDLFVGKVLGQYGATSDWLARGMYKALEVGARIISMSVELDFPGEVKHLVDQGWPVEAATSRALEEYMENVLLFATLARLMRAWAPFGKSAVIVAAAGNKSRRELPKPYTITVTPPAAAEGIVSVAAVDKSPGGLSVANFSNTGAVLAAPGVDVWSARPGGGVASMSGTSMAAPYVAGVAALWAEERVQSMKTLNVAQLEDFLVGRAKALPGQAAADIGAGLVQAPQKAG
jgi:subtilisin family serine protease